MNNFISVKCNPTMSNQNIIVEAAKGFVMANFTDITANRLGDIKICVSEAFENAVLFAFPKPKPDAVVALTGTVVDKGLCFSISDNGVGIEDVEQAIQPFFTTRKDNGGCGMGFSIMERFSTTLKVNTNSKTGTTVMMFFAIEEGD